MVGVLMRVKKLLAVAVMMAAAWGVSGCTTLQGVSLSEYTGGDKQVREDASSTQFLFFGYDGDLSHEVMRKLKKKCNHVSGVSTAQETSWYVFVTITRVTAEGYCQ